MRVISLFVHYAALHHRVTKIQIENNIYHKVMESQRLPFLLYLSLKFVSLCVYVYERIQQMHKILDDTHPNQKHITLQTIERLLIFCASLMCVFYGVLQNENLSNFKHKQNCIQVHAMHVCVCILACLVFGQGKTENYRRCYCILSSCHNSCELSSTQDRYVLFIHLPFRLIASQLNTFEIIHT